MTDLKRIDRTSCSIPSSCFEFQAGESGLAQTTFGRAALLIHLTEDKATQLAYKLCQVRDHPDFAIT